MGWIAWIDLCPLHQPRLTSMHRRWVRASFCAGCDVQEGVMVMPVGRGLLSGSELAVT
jgi:hypothetical protein